MSADTASRMRPSRVGRPTKLASGEVACQYCGTAVMLPEKFEYITTAGQEGRLGDDAVVLSERPRELVMTQCVSCTARLVHANRILDRHPIVARRLGSRSHALNVVEASLGALEALGVSAARADQLVSSDRELRQIIQALATAGVAVRWIAKFVPYIELNADPDSCSASGWEHIDDGKRQMLRDAYGSLLRIRTDAPMPVPPPEGRACLLCGVGTIMVLQREAAKAWGWLRKANPGTVGGQAQPEPVLGHLCPACARAADAVGAIGPTALESALLEFVGVSVRGFGTIQLRGYRAWCAMPEGTPPNSTPWAHEPNLESLSEEVQRA